MSAKVVYSTTYHVTERDLDLMGHVNNAAYLEILEDARWKVLADHDIHHHSIALLGTGPVIMDIHLKFIKEVKLRETIEIKSWFEPVNERISRIDQQIFNSKSELATEAQFVFGIMDIKARKLVKPPEPWYSLFHPK